MTRKTFLGGFGAAFGSAVLPATAFAKAGEPIMRFGVASDVHIAVGWKEGGDPERLGLRSQPYFLEKALRWFDANKADAVVFSGDMAHTGRMEELEKLVEVWNKVFRRELFAEVRFPIDYVFEDVAMIPVDMFLMRDLSPKNIVRNAVWERRTLKVVFF